jgi:transcription antitermination protein NusB
MKSRTKARSVALQVLYELDQSGHLPGDIVSQRIGDYPLDDGLCTFVQKIVFGVVPLKQILDNLISQHAPEWPFDQVAIIDRNILRMSLWEITFEPDTPIKVVINEAIELGKLYGSDSSPRFINGVLGSLVDNQNTICQILRNEKDKLA